MMQLIRSVGLFAMLALPVSAADDFRKPYVAGARARVVVVEDRDAITALKLNPEVIRQMVDRGIQGFTGQTNVATAWLGLIATNDVVGIKVHSSPGRVGGTRPEVVAGVVEGLVVDQFPWRMQHRNECAKRQRRFREADILKSDLEKPRDNFFLFFFFHTAPGVSEREPFASATA